MPSRSGKKGESPILKRFNGCGGFPDDSRQKNQINAEQGGCFISGVSTGNLMGDYGGSYGEKD
jgi:hypothetical protein